MIISLINNPNDTFPGLPFYAAKMSRGVDPWNCSDITDASKIELLLKLQKLGHLSVFEHTLFTFYLGEVSRICLDQLNRYRHASICMESGRHTDWIEREIVIPPSFPESSLPEVTTLLENIKNTQTRLSSLGIPREDTRFLTPLGVSTQEIFSINMREIFLIQSQRLCTQAQWEIRELVAGMQAELIAECPSLEPFLEVSGPPCGTCPHPCKSKE